MIHGRYGTYVHKRCRCTPCRAAMSLYNREYRRPRQIHGSMHGAKSAAIDQRSIFVVNTWFGAFAV